MWAGRLRIWLLGLAQIAWEFTVGDVWAMCGRYVGVVWAMFYVPDLRNADTPWADASKRHFQNPASMTSTLFSSGDSGPPSGLYRPAPPHRQTSRADDPSQSRILARLEQGREDGARNAKPSYEGSVGSGC